MWGFNKKKRKEKQAKKEEEVQEIKPKRGINEKLDHLTETLDNLSQSKKKKDQLKKKMVKMPYGVKSQLKRLAIKNKALVVLLKANRCIETKIGEMRDGFLLLDERIYQGSPDFVYMWQGKYPCVVIKEWDLSPIGVKDYYDSVDDGRSADAQQIIINALEFRESMMPKKLGGKAIIWIIIGGCIVGYALFAQ
jgi:hypothetical protein|tara:strand:+ start:11027 stop:11605 length:579 start_codon:yes stop_codon:yes gene_type:complete